MILTQPTHEAIPSVDMEQPSIVDYGQSASRRIPIVFAPEMRIGISTQSGRAFSHQMQIH